MLQNNTRDKIEEMKVLNIFKLNIYQVLTFMFKLKWDTAPAAFWNDFWNFSRNILSVFYRN